MENLALPEQIPVSQRQAGPVSGAAPLRSRRPATTGSVVPGNHTQTYASSCSEFIRRWAATLDDPAGQQRQPVFLAVENGREFGWIRSEQAHAYQTGHLEGGADSDRRVPVLHLAERLLIDMGPVGEIPGCHATAAPCRRNLQTQDSDGVECLG
jgi:hypothetical protein